MKWLTNIFGSPGGQKSASIAKDRLKIMITQQRSAQSPKDNYDLVKADVLAVVAVRFFELLHLSLLFFSSPVSSTHLYLPSQKKKKKNYLLTFSVCS